MIHGQKHRAAPCLGVVFRWLCVEISAAPSLEGRVQEVVSREMFFCGWILYVLEMFRKLMSIALPVNVWLPFSLVLQVYRSLLRALPSLAAVAGARGVVASGGLGWAGTSVARSPLLQWLRRSDCRGVKETYFKEALSNCEYGRTCNGHMHDGSKWHHEIY